MRSSRSAHAGRNARWRVGIQADPINAHSTFVLAGLFELQAAGDVSVHDLARRLPRERAMWLEVDDREARTIVHVCVDLTDKDALAAPGRTSAADVTWKRGYRSSAGYGVENVKPLGLILPARSEHQRATLSSLGHVVISRRSLLEVRTWVAAQRRPPPIIREYESPPGAGTASVLFQARAWEPDQGMDPEDREQRNNDRAELIRTLRGALGDRFVGGFVDTPFARRFHGDLISDALSDRRSYLELVRGSRIGISSAGLQDSNPYKLAEYLAASRAIVSEPLCHEIPEPLREGANLITFDSPTDAVDACVRLLDEPDLCAAMQENNGEHWRSYVHPAALLRRRLSELSV